MAIYTKTGDEGETSLLGKKRVSKSNAVFSLLGTFDELNASLGVISDTQPKTKEILNNIQNDIFMLGSILAGYKESADFDVKLNNRVEEFESNIDEISTELPELTNFILPGGCDSAAKLHFSRAVCRRLERETVAFFESEPKAKYKSVILKYVNRLSDLLFVLARYENYKKGVQDIIWKGN